MSKVDLEKYFLVQALYLDGDMIAMAKPASQIIRDLGFRDCSGTEYEVYDVHTFGKVVKLVEVAGANEPPNYHRLINPETGETAIEGYSPEH